MSCDYCWPGNCCGKCDKPEPSPQARLDAFNILNRHPPCLRDGVPLNDLIDDIAAAIDKLPLKRDQRDD